MKPPFDSDQFPEVLRRRPQWVLWASEVRDGKPTKVPYSAVTGEMARSNDPDTWCGLAAVLKVFHRQEHRFAGVGYVFAADDPFCGIDLDHCIDAETGELAPWAAGILADLEMYAEISPSGTGVKLILEGRLPRDGAGKTRHKKTGMDTAGGAVELYDELRFFTLTGRRLPGYPATVEPRQEALNQLHDTLFPIVLHTRAHVVDRQNPAELDDKALFETMLRGRNGPEIQALWNGATGAYDGDDSRADAALCTHLAFYTQGDEHRIDRLFRQSGLYREKWERQDYRDRTISLALTGMTEFYQPARPPVAPARLGPAANGQGPADAEGEIDLGAELAIRAAPWPEPLLPEALHGILGEIVRTVAPHTEGDPAAILIQSLVCFGNMIGRHAFFRAESDCHYGNLYGALVGASAKARKGSSYGQVRRFFSAVEPEWIRDHQVSGLSSGEGLIWQVRDRIEKQQPVKQKGRVVDYETVIEDHGVEDKRLLVYESELASALRVLAREGNTLSAVIRNAWDTGDLKSLTKNSPARATGAHISIIGHITREELLRYLNDTEAGNGFANRILWVCVRRSQCLPEGGALHLEDIEPLIEGLGSAVRHARGRTQMERDPGAAALWRRIYPTLAEGKPGLLGAVLARGEGQVMRLAMLYALLDCEPYIRTQHLTAALAVWEYCEQSARFIFGDTLGDPLADDLLTTFRGVESGMSRTEIYRHFGCNMPAARISRALESLQERDLVYRTVAPTGGRPVERWHLRSRLGTENDSSTGDVKKSINPKTPPGETP